MSLGFRLALWGTIFLFGGCHDGRRGKIDRAEVAALLDRAAEWQIANFDYAEEGSPGKLHDNGIDAWTNATLYSGLLDWADVSPEPAAARYLDWLGAIGEKNGWAMPANFVGTRYGIYHADELCVGQFYFGMYGRYGDPKMVEGVKARLDSIMANPPSVDMTAKVKQSWTWCDALFMAPPVPPSRETTDTSYSWIRFSGAHTRIFITKPTGCFSATTHISTRKKLTARTSTGVGATAGWRRDWRGCWSGYLPIRLTDRSTKGYSYGS